MRDNKVVGNIIKNAPNPYEFVATGEVDVDLGLDKSLSGSDDSEGDFDQYDARVKEMKK